MKMIVAVVKPFKLTEVWDELTRAGVQGVTVTEVKGFGRQKGKATVHRGPEYEVNFLPKMKLELAIADKDAERICEVIRNAAYTGKVGDGKIFVFDMEHVMRIRTGEVDIEAI